MVFTIPKDFYTIEKLKETKHFKYGIKFIRFWNGQSFNFSYMALAQAKKRGVMPIVIIEDSEIKLQDSLKKLEAMFEQWDKELFECNNCQGNGAVQSPNGDELIECNKCQGSGKINV